MNTLLVSHSACLYHEPPLGHPESPDRLRAVLHALEGEAFAHLQREDAPRATIEQLARVHPRFYIDAILGQVPGEGYHPLDRETFLSSGSGEAALRAAGALVLAVDRIVEGAAGNAFCAVRPPGHHAEPTRAMGFCLFNNVAVGALHAREAHGLDRIAIIDFDVHHGNGTQALVADDPNLFYGSIHQSPFYPGTGAASERGLGNIVNAPLPAGADGAAFRAAMTRDILPALERFKPEMLFISAGFDAHEADPMAGLRLDEEDFGWATQVLMEVAGKHCAGRFVSTLEGGYDLAALASCTRAHVRALMGL